MENKGLLALFSVRQGICIDLLLVHLPSVDVNASFADEFRLLLILLLLIHQKFSFVLLLMSIDNTFIECCKS